MAIGSTQESIEQSAAYLAHRLVDVGLAKRALAGELVEDGAKPFRQRLEHSFFHPLPSW